MASRARQNKKDKMKGITRMDAALDAMRPLGFRTQLIRRTVNELLDVYDGNQGWPFIEEASYKLLIETLLSKQEDFAEDKDGAWNDVVNDTSSAGLSEVGSSGMGTEDTPLHTSAGLVSQANVQDNASLGNLETDVTDLAVGADSSGGHEQDMNKPENELKPADDVKGSKDNTIKRTSDRTPIIQSSKVFKDNTIVNYTERTSDKAPLIQSSKAFKHNTIVNNIESISDKTPMIQCSKAFKHNTVVNVNNIERTSDKTSLIQSSKAFKHNTIVNNIESTSDKKTPIVQSSKAVDHRACSCPPGGCHGWIDYESDDVEELVHYPVPPLSRQIEKMIGQDESPESSSRRRRRSRWDEKPEGM